MNSLLERRKAGEKVGIADFQEALAASNAWWQIIFEQAGLALAIGDPSGKVVAVSPSFEKMFGYSGQEIVDTGGIANITHPDDLPLDMELFGELVRGERDHYQLEKRYFHKDGRLIWGRLTVMLLRGDDPEATLVVAMAQDITETKEAQEREALSIRHEQALELNDHVVQGLVVAKMALEGGLDEKARESLVATLENVRTIVKDLLAGMPERPGGLTRPPSISLD
ncbi:MAG: PAS domain S-box protein [Actinomycetota bacterium]